MRERPGASFGAAVSVWVGSSVFIELRLTNEVVLTPDDAVGRARFLRDHPDQKPQWPSWRRVDLVVENVLIARLRTEP
jgi:hypothetical protein